MQHQLRWEAAWVAMLPMLCAKPHLYHCVLGKVLHCESRIMKWDSRGSREHPWTSLGGGGTSGSHIGGSLGMRPAAACGTLPAPVWRLLPRVRSGALLSHPGTQGLALLGGCQSPLGHPSLPGMYPGGRGGREPFPSLCLQLGAEGRMGDGCGGNCRCCSWGSWLSLRCASVVRSEPRCAGGCAGARQRSRAESHRSLLVQRD